ncbi:MAG: hypothetical protein ACKOJF_34490, partial [Planctomycetaceae bacterium]
LGGARGGHAQGSRASQRRASGCRASGCRASGCRGGESHVVLRSAAGAAGLRVVIHLARVPRLARPHPAVSAPRPTWAGRHTRLVPPGQLLAGLAA